MTYNKPMTKRQTDLDQVRSNLELAKTSNAHVATVHLGDDEPRICYPSNLHGFGAKKVSW